MTEHLSPVVNQRLSTMAKLIFFLSSLLMLILVLITVYKAATISGPPTSPTVNISSLYKNKTNTNETITESSCSLNPPKLIGRLFVNTTALPMSEIEGLLPSVQTGGHFRPADCVPEEKIAIIVPYRDRDEHLRLLLRHLHPILMRQNQIEYQFFVVEQAGTDSFNRGKMNNAGFLEALKILDFDCVIFQDVELLPEDDRILYVCPEKNSPKHMSVAYEGNNFKLSYPDMFGGVVTLTREQFVTINGFSNEFWGWGGEDDYLSYRVRTYNFTIAQYDEEIGRYTQLKHPPSVINQDRFVLLGKSQSRLKSDGLSSINYILLETSFKKLYTHILVDIGKP